MTSRSAIVMYLGGFARVGGIESFARDFLTALAPYYPQRELLIWGKSARSQPLLEEMAATDVAISGTAWRWGCAWNWPDYALLPHGLRALERAAVVVFKRPPPLPILRRLRLANERAGRRLPFLLITPYRPAEYWNGKLEADYLENFDAITVQSEDGRRDLEQAGYRGRIANIPLLPPETTSAAPYPVLRDGNPVRVGFLGRLAAQKNLIYALDVIRLLTARNDGARYEFHVFGDGAERESLQRRATELGLKNVTFHGELTRDEIPSALDSCDLFLNTSTTEGQCLAALEILSRGRPLVATPVGALPEVISRDELGRLAPLDQPEAFAQALADVVQDIRTGRITPESVVATFRERFDHASMLKRYLDLLRDLGVPPPSMEPARELIRSEP